MRRFITSGLCMAVLCIPFCLLSQIAVISKTHWIPDTTNSNKAWLALEGQFHDKVIMKNHFILDGTVLYHFYTDDASELLFMQTYENLSELEKSHEKGIELVKATWPDSLERRAMLRKRFNYYSLEHSDEIYSLLPFTKRLQSKSDSVLYYYFRMLRAKPLPENGSIAERTQLLKEHAEKVILKNETVLAYYPMVHFYGGDGRDFLQVFVFKSFDDLNNLQQTNIEIIKAAWPDEKSQNEFYKKLSEYLEPWHGDKIYTYEPRLTKL